jgi:hypothetical protein
MSDPSIPYLSPVGATALKTRLVSLGLFALSHGDMAMVQTLTVIIQRRGLRHE